MRINTDLRVSIDDLPSNLYLVNEAIKQIHDKMSTKDKATSDIARALELIKEKRKTTAGLGGIERLIKNALNQRVVYAVESGCRFEDCSVGPIFSSIELARKFAEKLVKERNEERIKANENGYDFDLFVKEGKDVWLTATECIRVRFCQVIESL